MFSLRRVAIAADTGRAFLSSLLRNAKGNTLALMAAAIIPIAALSGSAVDAARMYLVKVRLQQACDAGVLAGRKFMGTSTLDDASKAKATTYFNNNFRAGWMQTSAVSFRPSQTVDNTVDGAASATVDMTVMKMFGMQPVVLTVACQSKLEIPNVDVMFVLDTTGSMNDTNIGDTQSKIAGLRAAVLSFRQTLEDQKAATTQIRYGFVPYATNVNVGLLLKREWMVDSAPYQSREGQSITSSDKSSTATTITETIKNWYQISGSVTTAYSYVSQESCTAPTSTNKTVQSIKIIDKVDGDYTYFHYTRVTIGTAYSAAISGSTCKITAVTYDNYVEQIDQRSYTCKTNCTTTTTTWTYNWTYGQRTITVSGLKGSLASGLMAGGTYKIPNMAADTTNHKFVDSSAYTWNGCIEERQTVPIIDYNNIPSNAYDLDIDKVPTGDDATKWKPALKDAIYARKSTTNWSYPSEVSSSNYTRIADLSSGFYTSCPTASRKLATMAGTAGYNTLNTYLNSLTPSGNTYHDIGMIWGARLISPTGLFASENAAAPNGTEISRHIIFMTDGDTDTDRINYEAYGLSALDRRRTASPSTTLPTDTDQNAIVASRLGAVCKAAKAKNITVWVIAYGTSLTSMLSSCASPGRAYQAGDTASLNTTFARIAAQIAQLRISQ